MTLLDNVKKNIYSYWSILIAIIIESFFLYYHAIGFDLKYINWINDVNNIFSIYLKLEPLYIVTASTIQQIIKIDIKFILHFLNELLLIILLLLSIKIFKKVFKDNIIANIAVLFVYFSPVCWLIKNALHRNFLGIIFFIFSLYIFLILLKKYSLKKYILLLLIGVVLLLTHRVVFFYYALSFVIFLLFLIKEKRQVEFFSLAISCGLSGLLGLFFIKNFFLNNIQGFGNFDTINWHIYLTNIFDMLIHNFHIQFTSILFSIFFILSIVINILFIKKHTYKYTTFFLLFIVILFIIYKSDVFLNITNTYAERIMLIIYFFLPIILYHFLIFICKKQKIVYMFMFLFLINFISTTTIRIISETNIIGKIFIADYNNYQKNINTYDIESIKQKFKIKPYQQYTGNGFLNDESNLQYFNIWYNIQNLPAKKVYQILKNRGVTMVTYDSINRIRFIGGEYNRIMTFNESLLCDNRYFTKIYQHDYLFGNFYIFRINDQENLNDTTDNHCIKNEKYLGENFLEKLDGNTLYINDVQKNTRNDILLHSNAKTRVIINKYQYFYILTKNDFVFISNAIITNYNVMESLDGAKIIFGKINNPDKVINIFSYNKKYINIFIMTIGYLCFIVFFLLHYKKFISYNNQEKNTFLIFFLLIIMLTLGYVF